MSAIVAAMVFVQRADVVEGHLSGAAAMVAVHLLLWVSMRAFVSGG